MSTRRMWLVLARFTEPHGAAAPGFTLRPVTEQDSSGMPLLLYEAYRDSVEGAGGSSLDEAQAEILRVWAARYGKLIDEASFVAVKEDGGVAAAALVVHAVRPLLVYLVTHPSAQSHGLGTALLARSVSALKQLGHMDLWVGLREENEGARRLFERVGFVEA